METVSRDCLLPSTHTHTTHARSTHTHAQNAPEVTKRTTTTAASKPASACPEASPVCWGPSAPLGGEGGSPVEERKSSACRFVGFVFVGGLFRGLEG